MVGTGIGRGRNLTYSDHGVGAHPLVMCCPLFDMTRCDSKYSMMSPRADSSLSAVKQESIEDTWVYLAASSIEKLFEILVDLGIVFNGV